MRLPRCIIPLARWKRPCPSFRQKNLTPAWRRCSTEQGNWNAPHAAWLTVTSGAVSPTSNQIVLTIRGSSFTRGIISIARFCSSFMYSAIDDRVD